MSEKSNDYVPRKRKYIHQLQYLKFISNSNFYKEANKVQNLKRFQTKKAERKILNIIIFPVYMAFNLISKVIKFKESIFYGKLIQSLEDL